MLKWLLGLVLVLASVVGTAAVSRVAAQGVPQELKALNTKVADIQATLDGINSKLDNIDPTVNTDIFTGPLQRSSTATANFKCMAVNVGTANANFTIEIHNQGGGVEASETCTDVAPGVVCSREAITSDQVTYCHVSGIAAKDARVTLCAREGATCTAFVTAP